MKGFLELSRVPVSLMAAFSAGTGYVLIAPSWALSHAWIPVLGVFSLAAGASALNQVQERNDDALMERTRNRPLPSGRILPGKAVAFAMMAILFGLALLLWTDGLPPRFCMGILHPAPTNAWMPIQDAAPAAPSSFSLLPCALGAFSIIWYNGFYTPLKRKSAFAAVPGAVAGALPPAIGWSMGGGSLQDPALLMLMTFLFLWQVPHFWLIVLKREDEYRRAGFPLPTDRIPSRRFRAVVLSWMAAASLVALALPLFGPLGHPLLFGSVLVSILIMAWLAARSFLGTAMKIPSLQGAYLALNLFAVLVLVLSAAGRLMEFRP